MISELREFDWQRFWLLEVVILGASMLITVMTSHAQPPLNKTRLGILLVTALGLTVFNLILSKNGKGRVNRR